MKNKKGFTLVELLVSFTLITIVAISLFKTVLVIQQKEEKSISYNKYLAFVSTFNSAIETDFVDDKITIISSCGTNCYNITYSESGTKKLKIDIDTGTMVYGSIKEELPDNYIFYNDLELNIYNFTSTSSTSFDSMIEIMIPLKSNLSGNYSDIKYIYQYNSITDPVSES
ncbi:MAG TPA: prepilin-type N-terminal cleavage/methylation domain-containing protein [Bacilli bacterium]|nr:prepilin-type N-terminal cleavage/methylation domain-containing protein [Bacilli bacterium]